MTGLLLFLAVLTATPPSIFVDRTAEAGLDFVHFNGMSGKNYFAEVVGAGGALFDYDDDGDLDLYLVQGHMLGDDLARATVAPRHPLPLTDRLYRNDLEGGTVKLVDVTAASGIVATGYGMGAAVGDYDNDGDLDLYVTNFDGPNQLWRNEGDNTFTEVAGAAGVGDRRWGVAATFLDFDGDGWLDLFVGNYMDYTLAKNKTCLTESGLRDYCGPSSYGHESDALYRNRGGGESGVVTFEDVSKPSGIAAEPAATLGAIAADLNGDGRVDLYVANDETPNHLWIHQGAKDGVVRFTNDALLAGCALNRDGQAEASMGVDAADFDGDGDLDLFMTHLSRESNTLYTNDGTGLFHDRSLEMGLANPSWRFTGFGTSFFDYDNDGWLDLLTTNGAVYVILELAREKDPYPLHQPNQLFRNLEGKGFAEVTARAGPAFQVSEVSRGAVFGDVDNDGDTDVVVTNNSGPARLLINQVGQERHWLGLGLVNGARVAVHSEGKPPLWRRAKSDGSFASANDPRVLVGLGEEAKVSHVEVHWPGGEVERFADLAVDTYHVLVKGTGSGK